MQEKSQVEANRTLPETRKVGLNGPMLHCTIGSTNARFAPRNLATRSLPEYYPCNLLLDDYTGIMFDPMSDESDIRTARSRFNARKTESPLIAWICSDVWTHPTEWTRYPDQYTRGLVHTSGEGTYGDNVASGEINAYMRDHVDAFA